MPLAAVGWPLSWNRGVIWSSGHCVPAGSLVGGLESKIPRRVSQSITREYCSAASMFSRHVEVTDAVASSRTRATFEWADRLL